MKLSRHVVKTTDNDRDVYYNTVTRDILSIDADEDTLRRCYCLAGQEDDAIKSVVLGGRPHKYMGMHITVTWACNLRCTHCMIQHKLEEEHTAKLDIDGVCDFARKCKERYHLETIFVRFSGGESLLALDECVELIAKLSEIVNIDYSLYTNLTLPLTEKQLEFFKGMSSVGVSIDGLEEHHNQQRKPLKQIDNPFQTTLHNLKQLVLAGLKDKISVQACLRDEAYNIETRRDFYRLMLRHGINSNNIEIGIASPSATHPIPGKLFVDSLEKYSLASNTCCKYRLSSIVIDNNGDILSDYYSMARLGTIYDDLTTIEENHDKLVLDTISPLNDQKCRACPVVAYCWGGCTFVENTGHRLSKYCDKRKIAIQEKIADLTKSGTLIQQVVRNVQHIH